jgi:hypothetical protein
LAATSTSTPARKSNSVMRDRQPLLLVSSYFEVDRRRSSGGRTDLSGRFEVVARGSAFAVRDR